MDLLLAAAVVLFAAVFVLCLIFIPDKPVEGKIVSLEGEKEIVLAIKNYNCTNPETEVFLTRSVGKYGHYKINGFDYELGNGCHRFCNRGVRVQLSGGSF